MEGIIIGAIGLSLLMVLIFTSIPIAFCFATIGFVGIWVIGGFAPAMQMMGTTITYTQVSSYMLIVIPLFMLMGQWAGESGLVAEAFNSARMWLGRLPGGLAISVTFAAIIFGAVSGSGMATIITMTKVAWPEMKRYNYSPSLSLGACIATGGIDNLIPPSIALIFYAMLSGESVGRLFIGGIMPGVLIAVLIIISIFIICKVNPEMAPPAPKSSWRMKFASLKPTWSIFLLIVFVLGSIWAGICTPNEAAGIGAAGALVIGLFKKRLNWSMIWKSISNVSLLTSAILVLFIALGAFNTFMSLSRLPQELSQWVISMDLSKNTIVWVIMVLYIILGIPLEAGPIMLLTVPIFIPLLDALNVDLVWFGILTTIAMGLAAITPPVGNPMFIVHGMVKHEGIRLSTIFMGATFYCVPVIIGLLLCLFFPEIVTWLPNTMMDLRN